MEYGRGSVCFETILFPVPLYKGNKLDAVKK
jgi:hypothetical protein